MTIKNYKQIILIQQFLNFLYTMKNFIFIAATACICLLATTSASAQRCRQALSDGIIVTTETTNAPAVNNAPQATNETVATAIPAIIAVQPKRNDTQITNK
jgi:hypothetical protein